MNFILKIIGKVTDFIVETFRTIVLILCLPLIWFMELFRWIREKLFGSM